MIKFSIGQQVRITAYSHPHCGEFGIVRSVLCDGAAAIVTLKRLGGRLVTVMFDQVIPAPSMSFDGASARARSVPTGDTESFSRSSHYS